MSSYAPSYFPNSVGPVKPHFIFGGIVENMDGNTMYVAEYVKIDTKEVEMILDTGQPLTLRWALILCGVMLAGAATIAGGFYAMVHSDVNDVRASVDTVRDGASSDVNLLRSEMKADNVRMYEKFDKVGDKLDRITDIVTETKIQQAKSKN